MPPDEGVLPDPPPVEGDPPDPPGPEPRSTVDTAFFAATMGALASDALDFKPAALMAATVTE